METIEQHPPFDHRPCQKAVCFLIFNRPECTERVFATIRQAQPPRLYVVADGPRVGREGEKEKCLAAREVIARNLDWDCEIKTLYAEENLGCRKRISSGIDWLFGHEEEAILVEDDCLPEQSFFRYCEELLDYYRSDERVMMIAGTNQSPHQCVGRYSYLFNPTGHIWGWATWRRAWKHYDVDMKIWPQARDGHWLMHLNATLKGRRAVAWWEKALDEVYYHRIDTWDWQWNLAYWLQHGMSVIPSRNLVSNIGFGIDSTHTSIKHSLDDRRPIHPMSFPLAHPRYMAGDALAEDPPLGFKNRLAAVSHKLRFRSDGSPRLPSVTRDLKVL